MDKKVVSDAPISVEDIIGSPKEIKIEEKPTDIVVDTVKTPPVPAATVIVPTPVSSTTRPYFRSRPVYNNNYSNNNTSNNYSNNNYANNSEERSMPDANLPTESVEGTLDLSPNGHGYLRPERMPSDHDIYISSSQIRRFQLRPGDAIAGQARRPKENERYWGLLKVEKINGVEVEKVGVRPSFDQLTPIYPNEQLKLETDQDILTTRMIDLICPIGKGQRGLIVSPPKAGKTWLIKDIATAIGKNYPEIHLMAVLIGERPEEVTDINYHIKEVTGGKGEVYSSNFDEDAGDQTKIAEMGLERAKRMVEQGQDVLIILDSITRLARAYNLAMPTSGRTLTGGFDPAALFPAKHFFGAARNIDKGGSLTIIGTSLVDTGSRMDDLVYEEFKGTGNMELHLDRRLAERRVFPAFDIQRSGTRGEEKLYDKKIFDRVMMMRRLVDMMSQEERTEMFINRLRKTKNNEEFLETLNKSQ